MGGLLQLAEVTGLVTAHSLLLWYKIKDKRGDLDFHIVLVL